MRFATLIALSSVVLALPQPILSQTPDVNVTITCDNAYGFGYGSATAMANYFGGVFNSTAGQIFNCSGGPETYVVSGAATDDYLYIVTWSDDAVTQGVIGQFTPVGGPTTYTGYDIGWEVYATGMDFDGSPGPTLAQINAEIPIANAAAGTPGLTSVGWVGTTSSPPREGVLVHGEDNTTPAGGTCANPFPIVCPESSGQPNAIDDEARWMWYRRPGATCAFLDGNHREFLIFRLPILVVPVETKTWGEIKERYR